MVFVGGPRQVGRTTLCLQEDTQGDKMELRFLRDVEKREVDFVVLKNSSPLFAVECKTGEKTLSPHIRYFSQRTTIPKFFKVHMGNADYAPEKNIRVLPFPQFCREINLP